MIHRPIPTRDAESCNHDWLVKLSRDQLDENIACQLAEHLEYCDDCREKLTQLSFAETNWSDTRTVILEQTERRADTTTTVGLKQKKLLSKPNSLVRWIEPLSETPQASSVYIGQVDGYLVKSVIGYGGMGVVLEAWDSKLNRAVAIKAMHPHLAANGTARQRFVREARGAAAVVHPNVVAIHTVHAEHDPPYFIMPLIAGESLQTRIDKNGPLDVDASLRVAIQISDGLAAAHAQGLVHRDIKPANIIVEHGTERALLTDFGVVRALNETTMTASGVIAGTPEYMSPEQASGGPVDSRSDLFSLGCVLYAMLTGHSPFRSDTTWGVLRRIEKDTPRPLSELRPELPEAVESIVSWLLEKQPARRVDTATELANDLRQLLAHQIDRHRNELPSRIAKRLQHSSISARGILLTLILCSVLLVISTIAWSFLTRGTAFENREVSAGQETTPKTPMDSAGVVLPFDNEPLDHEIQQLDLLTQELEETLKTLMQQPQ